jgi:hypothetical protein
MAVTAMDTLDQGERGDVVKHVYIADFSECRHLASGQGNKHPVVPEVGGGNIVRLM